MDARMAAAGATTEKAYEGNAWILLFTGSAFLAIYPVIALGVVALTGRDFSDNTWNEVVAFSPSLAGFFVYSMASILGLGIFGMAITGISYRRGERWAWFALWYLPAFAVAGEVADVVIESTHAYSFLVIGFLSVVGLLLPFRKFFPRAV